METTLRVSIPEVGKAVGTAGWVANYISNLELSFKHSDGVMKIVGREKTEACNRPWFVIAKTGDRDGFQRYSDDISCLWEGENASNCPDANVAMFGYLTPAAERYVWSFIKLCCEELKSYIDNDPEIGFNLKIVRE